MATEADDLSRLLDKFGEEYLNCTICHERYNQPKILTCLHSFCEGCLLQYQVSQGPVKLTCPVCRQETVILESGVAGLKTNFPLRGMVEAFQQNEKILASGRYSPSVGEQIQAPAPQQRTVCNCRKHAGERVWFYCETCQDLVCRVCTTKTHREHDFQEIDTAAVTCRESLRGYCPRLEDLLNSLEGALEGLRTSKSQIAASGQKTKEEVSRRAHAAVSLVMAAKERILTQIEASETERNKKFKEQTKGLTTLRDRVRHSLTVTEHLTSSARDEDLLALFPLIRGDLKDLSVQSVSNPDPGAFFMALLPATEQIVLDLGRLVLEAEKWKMIKKVGRWGNDKEDFDGARGVAVCSDGEIAIADLGLWSRGIILFTPDWSYKESIKIVNNPRDVASANGCIFVVDNTPYVKAYNAERKLAFEFSTTDGEGETAVNIVSIAINKSKGSILVGDAKRNVLTEHRAVDGRLLRTIATNVPPYFLAVDQEGGVFVSGLDTGEIERVDVGGRTEITVKPVIEGGDQVSCRGVCCDKEGTSFYVIVHGKESNIGHIHQYSHSGIFLGCLARDLYDPNGITLTARRELAVADCFSVKVFEKINAETGV